MTNTKNHGSTLESLRAEDDLLNKCQFAAIKTMLAMQIEQSMAQQGITKTAMASRMGTTRAQLDRLLDPSPPSSAPPKHLVND